MSETAEKKNQYSISELAKEFDITTRAIRYYEDMGLLSPQRNGQQRIYSPGDRVKLKLVLRGKRLGLSLAESREIIEMYDPASGNRGQMQKLLNIIQLRRAQLQEQLEDIKVMLIDLESAEERIQTAMKHK